MINRKLCALAIVLLFGLFVFTHDARAQTVSGYTSIDYYEDTNIVDAYSETDEDYDVDAAYGAFVKLSVVDQNYNSMGVESATDDGTYGYAAVEIQFSGSPDSTYTAVGLHKAYASVWDYNYDNWPLVAIDYYDYYDFSFFETQDIFEPLWYSFLGPGPMFTRPTQPILLGSTTDAASVQTSSLKPDHLVLVENMDQTTYNACGSQVRTMKLRVVTTNGTGVPGASVRESFPNTNDTCNSSTVSPSGCQSTDGDTATFEDVTTVGCPYTNSTCGFSSIDKWQWCRSGGTPVTIATLRKDVRPYSITINGSEHYTGHPSFRR